MFAQLNPRMRNILLVGGVLLVAASLYILVWTPLHADYVRTKTRIEALNAKLEQAERQLQTRRQLDLDFAKRKAQLEALEKKMFKGERPSIISARMQEIMGEICRKQGVSIRTVRMLKQNNIGDYLEVRVKIEMDSPIDGFSHILYDLFHNEYLFLTPEVTITSTGRKNKNVRVSMILSALMKEA